VTTDGKILNGLLRRTSPDAWTVITGTNQSVQLAPADVEETHLGKVSVMPAGLDQQLTPQQLADLIAYLKACR
jgi:putative heme-binding domain-containing protein